MKIKAISKIPYITAKKAPTRRPKKKYDYIAVVNEENIAQESHLFIEIYKNDEKSLNEPIRRYVYTKKDWCKYVPVSGTWQKTRIVDIRREIDWTNNSEETTYISGTDIIKIKAFVNKKIWDESRWWEYIQRLEDDIIWTNKKRRLDKKKEKLEKRCDSISRLPKDFVSWYKKELFKDINHLYYKRKGRYATFFCSHCGKEYKIATKRKDTYEGQFEHIVEVPRNGEESVCEICKAKGVYKTAGKMKTVYGLRKQCYIGQKTERGVVFRYFEVEKIFSISQKESYISTEIARVFFEEGKKPQKDYKLRNNWTGKEDWHYHNVGGFGAQIVLKPAMIYPGTLDELQGTFLQYSGVENYIQAYKKIQIARYMEIYQQMPFMEMLSKVGMHELVESLVVYGNYYSINQEAKKPEEILKIKKEKLKFLIKEHGEPDLLRVLQKEKEMGQQWTFDECKQIRDIRPNWQELRIALEHMTIKKFLHRVEKCAGCRIETCCGTALARVKNAATTYLDYLFMRESLGYNLDNSIIQFPRDINDAHRKMVLERDKEEIEARVKSAEEKFPLISRRYKELCKMYQYENEEYIIKPAHSAEEIITEGRILHHCVGGDNYLRKHNDGRTTILFLRSKDKPEEPYITVEIEKYRILQWYGAYDKKLDEEKIDKWLDDWVKAIRTKNLVADVSKASKTIAV